MEEKKITRTIRKSNQDEFEVEASNTMTVQQLKEACAEKAAIPAEEQRLIYKGTCQPYYFYLLSEKT